MTCQSITVRDASTALGAAQKLASKPLESGPRDKYFDLLPVDADRMTDRAALETEGAAVGDGKGVTFCIGWFVCYAWFLDIRFSVAKGPPSS